MSLLHRGWDATDENETAIFGLWQQERLVHAMVELDDDELFADPDRDLGGVLEEVARLSVRLVFQSALEAEVDALLGRGRYARGERGGRPGGARARRTARPLPPGSRRTAVSLVWERGCGPEARLAGGQRCREPSGLSMAGV